MDVNGTRFHLLEGTGDWQPLLDTVRSEGLQWREDAALLQLQAQAFPFPEPTDRASRLDLRDRRGAARDRYGNIYWICRKEAEICVLGADARSDVPFWPDGHAGPPTAEPPGVFRAKDDPSEPAARRLRGLAVTTHHYLVAGVIEPAGLLIFDLHAGGPPRQILWPQDIAFEPFDVAAAEGGGVVVLDRAERPARLWVLDRGFRVLAEEQSRKELAPGGEELFHPEGEQPERQPAKTFPLGVPLRAGDPPGDLDAVAICPLPDGTVLVLEHADVDRDDFTLHRFRMDQHLASVQAKPPVQHLRRRAYDMALADLKQDSGGVFFGRLFILANDGNQAFGFRIEAARDRPGETQSGLKLEAEPTYYPLSHFSGRELIGGSTVLYDFGGRWTELRELPRQRYCTDGTLVTPAFDGREPGCVWHRVFLEAVVPAGASVTVETYASDDSELRQALATLQDSTSDEGLTKEQAKAYLDGVEWREEPAPYRRHASDVAWRGPPEGRSEESRTGTWETLIQSSRGRWLALRLTLRGSGAETPCVANLRVSYPRFSYLDRYLPAIYRDDAGSADFLERYLAITEGLFTSLEERIASAHLLFDADAAPPEYLDWLASWFGVALDAGWDEARRRLMLRHMPQIFESRGTVPGLIRALRLATDPEPSDALFRGDVAEAIAGIRIRENWTRRAKPGVDPDAERVTGTWHPLDGRGPLECRFRDWLGNQYDGELPQVWSDDLSFPTTEPADPVAAQDWRRFLTHELPFTYEPVAADDRACAAWRAFLKRRHDFVERLNETYQLEGSAKYRKFSEVPLPRRLPAAQPQLRDWIRFVSAVAPLMLNAHRFVIQLPVDRSGRNIGPDPEAVRRVVAIEKPAHTEFSIEEYWSLFRVGDARLGFETVVDEGARVPPFRLGEHALAHAHLAARHPLDVAARFVVGRDAPSHRIAADQ